MLTWQESSKWGRRASDTGATPPSPRRDPELEQVIADQQIDVLFQPLIEPETRRSVNGVLQTTLRCAYTYRDIGGVRLYVRSYEGGSPGPTLRMKPGETLKMY